MGKMPHKKFAWLVLLMFCATVSHVIGKTRFVSDEFQIRVLKAIELCIIITRMPMPGYWLRTEIGLSDSSLLRRNIKNYAE